MVRRRTAPAKPAKPPVKREVLGIDVTAQWLPLFNQIANGLTDLVPGAESCRIHYNSDTQKLAVLFFVGEKEMKQRFWIVDLPPAITDSTKKMAAERLVNRIAQEYA